MSIINNGLPIYNKAARHIRNLVATTGDFFELVKCEVEIYKSQAAVLWLVSRYGKLRLLLMSS